MKASCAGISLIGWPTRDPSGATRYSSMNLQTRSPRVSSDVGSLRQSRSRGTGPHFIAPNTFLGHFIWKVQVTFITPGLASGGVVSARGCLRVLKPSEIYRLAVHFDFCYPTRLCLVKTDTLITRTRLRSP